MAEPHAGAPPDGGARGRAALASIATYAVAVALLIGLMAWALTFAFGATGDRRAVLVSAGLAFAVQLVAFVFLRLAPPGRALGAWGAGSLLRMAALAVYGLLVLRGAGLPPAVALVSFAGFLFLSMLVEPFVLNVRL